VLPVLLFISQYETIQLLLLLLLWVRARMPTGGMPTGGMPTGGMPTGGMPTSENCLVRAECRPWLGGMPTGRNAEYSHYERP